MVTGRMSLLLDQGNDTMHEPELKLLGQVLALGAGLICLPSCGQYSHARRVEGLGCTGVAEGGRGATAGAGSGGACATACTSGLSEASPRQVEGVLPVLPQPAQLDDAVQSTGGCGTAVPELVEVAAGGHRGRQGAAQRTSSGAPAAGAPPGACV